MSFFKGEQDYQDFVRKSVNRSMEKALLNSVYGRLVEPCFSPFSNPVPEVTYHTGGFIPFKKDSPFPELIVPPAPVEPEPVVEPESETVQTLRALVAERRRTLESAASDKETVEASLVYYRNRIEWEEKRLADMVRKIEAAEASIASTLADIEKLGGRPEEPVA